MAGVVVCDFVEHLQGLLHLGRDPLLHAIHSVLDGTDVPFDRLQTFNQVRPVQLAFLSQHLPSIAIVRGCSLTLPRFWGEPPWSPGAPPSECGSAAAAMGVSFASAASPPVVCILDGVAVVSRSCRGPPLRPRVLALNRSLEVVPL